ncbi:MAG TPA: hypothetical protein VGM23_09385, partial [Armatimonadota bacterium]
GKGEDGNTDLYYARAAVDATKTKPLKLMPFTLSEANQNTGMIEDTLLPNDTVTVFTGNKGPRAWRMRYFVPDMTKSLSLDVYIGGAATPTNVTLNNCADFTDYIAALNPANPADLPDLTREYTLQFTSVVGGKTNTYRLAFDPYRNKVRVLVQPAAVPDKITAIHVKGQPRLQRLTKNLAPDVYPMVSVERWRYIDPATGVYFYGYTYDANTNTYINNSLQLMPRIWLYWVRKHEDGLGSRVYYRTLRQLTRANTATPLNPTPDTGNAMLWSLWNETRNQTTGGLTYRTSVDMPERMLPMEVLSQDGMVNITRQSAGPNSPEAGLWVVSSASRDLFPPYPPVSKPVQKTEHDLYLQVINVPVPENN